VCGLLRLSADAFPAAGRTFSSRREAEIAARLAGLLRAAEAEVPEAASQRVRKALRREAAPEGAGAARGREAAREAEPVTAGSQAAEGALSAAGRRDARRAGEVVAGRRESEKAAEAEPAGRPGASGVVWGAAAVVLIVLSLLDILGILHFSRRALDGIRIVTLPVAWCAESLAEAIGGALPPGAEVPEGMLLGASYFLLLAASGGLAAYFLALRGEVRALRRLRRLLG